MNRSNQSDSPRREPVRPPRLSDRHGRPGRRRNKQPSQMPSHNPTEAVRGG